MNEAVAESLVAEGHELLNVGLPDPQDEHVLAAARATGASVLLTYNLSDFPATLLGHTGLTVLHPDTLLTLLFLERPADVLLALSKLRRNLSRPALSEVEVLLAFERLQLHTFVQHLRASALSF
jgi:hypothetical protein